MENKTIQALTIIFERHKEERVCVVGTTCVGKTTLLKQIPNCVDMDEALGAQLTSEEIEYICQTPWTKEIGDFYDRLVQERVKVLPGYPMFGTVIVECDVAVYLDIEDALLAERCAKRGVSLTDALNMKKAVLGDWEQHKECGGMVCYSLQVEE